MKIIQDFRNNYWEKKIKCNQCESELLVEDSDIFMHMPYKNQENPAFKCPCCYIINYVDVPKWLLIKLKNMKDYKDSYKG